MKKVTTEYEDGLGARATVNIDIAVRDGTNDEYRPGALKVTMFQRGAVCIYEEHREGGTYLYPEQLEMLMAALKLHQAKALKYDEVRF